VLASDSLDTANDFSHPEAVRVETRDVSTGQSFHVSLPPHSVSVLTLEAEP
jgi:alpha-L-arabinofuranosidase